MKGICRFGLILGAWVAGAFLAAPAFAATSVTLTYTTSPAEVSATTSGSATATKYVPIRPSGDNSTASFKITLSSSADVQVRIKNSTTDASADPKIKTYGQPLVLAGQSTANATTAPTFSATTGFNFSVNKTDQSLVDQTNKVVLYGRDAGSTSAITSTTLVTINVYVDGVAPSAPGNVSADGADKIVFVSWDAPASHGEINDVRSYRMVYSESDFSAASVTDAGNLHFATSKTTSGTIEGLTNGKTYYVSVKAVDWATNVSDFPRDTSGKIVTVKALPTVTLTLADVAGEKGGGCFIATAAYGSYQERHVRVLRQFRDRVLLSTEAGTGFVRWYYRTSPAYAAWIARHDAVRAIVRILLWPVYAGAYLMLHPLWALLAGFLLLGLAFARIARREAHA